MEFSFSDNTMTAYFVKYNSSHITRKICNINIKNDVYLKSEFYWIIWIVDIKKKQCFLANNDAHLNARKSKNIFCFS